jgi:hypothetical protein
MIELDPNELLDALEELAAQRQLVARLDREGIAEALAEAQRLAEGQPEHGAAAVFYAFGRRSARFGPAGRSLVDTLLRAQVVASGCDLEMSEIEFKILCARIALGQIDFSELRDWIAPRLRLLGQRSKRPPPKRPR